VNREADSRHARCVGNRKIRSCGQRSLVANLDLAAEMAQESAIRDADDRDIRDLAKRLDDAFTMGFVNRCNGQVTDDLIRSSFDDVDRTDVASGFSDGRGDESEHTRPVCQAHSQDNAVSLTGSKIHAARA
jgi:hypothetical protein